MRLKGGETEAGGLPDAESLEEGFNKTLRDRDEIEV